ncbi:putative serine/threonine-protein kinase PBL3 [Bidens hawaiensis]|uniref:putative serine/threonine-protein kinase PBL3 n=1 Tax=Bidens hawaiensis TaxID=980011 RepID=UPI00404B2FA9
MVEIVVALELSLTLQKKFDSPETPAVGLLSIGRMIKWPFISSEVNSAQTKPLEKDNISHASSSKEHCDLKKFSFDDLKKATRNFRLDMVIGQGDYGYVFKGLIDSNTSSLSVIDGPLKIAIKMLKSFQFQYNNKMQLGDMTFLSEFNHPNLVKIIGYCFECVQPFLIYEFMENGSLDNHLLNNNMTPLPWHTRFQIALGVTEAFAFLDRRLTWDYNHTIKLHQILLDKDFNAKVSDAELETLGKVDPYKLNEDPLYYCYPPETGKFLQSLLTFY